MEILPPNPTVYRLAAELILKRKESFTCYAIHRATESLGVPVGQWKMYLSQFAAFFDRYVPGTITIRPSGALQGQYDSNIKSFFNRTGVGVRRQERIDALLLMAEMCENPYGH